MLKELYKKLAIKCYLYINLLFRTSSNVDIKHKVKQKNKHSCGK